MTSLHNIPTELLCQVAEDVLPEDLMSLSRSCRRLRHVFGDQIQELQQRLKTSLRDVSLQIGGTEDHDDWTRPARLASELVLKPKTAIFWQRLCLSQGFGWATEINCGIRGLKKEYRLEEGGYVMWTLEHTDAVEQAKPALIEKLEMYKGRYDARAVDKCNPFLRTIKDDEFSESFRRALVRLQLSMLPNVRCLQLTTTERGDQNFAKKLIATNLTSLDTGSSPTSRLFRNLVKATLISKTQIQHRILETPQSFKHRILGNKDSRGYGDLELLQMLSNLPSIKDLRAYGIVSTTIDGSAQASDWPQVITIPTICFKRCALATTHLVNLINRTDRLVSFTYDHCIPEHVWNIDYHRGSEAIDWTLGWSPKPRTVKFNSGPSWNPQALLTALEENASQSLEILNLSSEMSVIPQGIKYQVLSLRQFVILRIVCLNVPSLPTICGKQKRKKRGKRYLDLVDFLPLSIQKLHLCGELHKAAATDLFRSRLTNTQCPLSNLSHVVSDHSIPLTPHYQRALERLDDIVFEVVERTSEQRHITPDSDEYLDQIWHYPDLKIVKKKGTDVAKVINIETK